MVFILGCFILHSVGIWGLSKRHFWPLYTQKLRIAQFISVSKINRHMHLRIVYEVRTIEETVIGGVGMDLTSVILNFFHVFHHHVHPSIPATPFHTKKHLT